MKKILSIILSLLIICSISPLSAIQASAETYSGTCGENLTWDFNTNNGTLMIMGSGKMTDYTYVRHSEVSGRPPETTAPWFHLASDIKFINISNEVTHIGSNAFSLLKNIEKVEIPSNVKTMYSAFKDCINLRNVTLPDGVLHIDTAFIGCTNLEEINLPNSIVGMNSAFEDCSNLKSIEIPNSVTSIKGTFKGCSQITSISIPESVKIIDGETFYDCTNLKSIYIPEGVEKIGFGAFIRCKSLKNITIPKSVSQIEDLAFMGCTELSDFTIPNNSTEIGWKVFDSCTSLENINIHNNIKKIGESAFSNCTNLKYVIISDSVNYIDERAFENCENFTDIYYSGDVAAWNNISIQQDNEEIHNANIHYNSLGPNSIEEKSIGGTIRSDTEWSINWKCLYKEDKDGNISDANLLIYTVGTAENEDLYIYMADGSAFPWETEPYANLKSAIENISIHGSSNINLRVATNSFKSYEKLEGLELDYVSGVDSNSFTDCPNLALVTIKDNSTFISYGSNVFKNCTKLKNVSFPDSLKYINAGAFKNTALGTITLDGELVEIKDGAFADCTNIKIRCYEDSVAHRFAVSNNIPYELISLYPNSSKIYYYDGDVKKEEAFLYNLEDYISETNSGTYSPKLAHMLAAMSASAYKSASAYEEPVLESLKSLGFEKTYKKYASNSVIDYSFGKMQMKNGQNLILVTIKGTGNIFDFEHWEQWGSNFTLGTDALFGASLHEGFSEAMEIVYADLLKFLNNDISNTVFVTTGHSRGAAVSNLLAVKLTNVGISSDNIYSYNFACPDVAKASGYEWNPNGEFNNIFNIGHAGDVVSITPGKNGNIVGASSSLFYQWGKFGRSYWWAFDWTDAGELAYDFSFASHTMTLYLQYMRREYSLDLYKEWLETQFSWLFPLGRLLNIACPVDVEVKNSNGKLIASVIDGTANYYDSEYGDVVILTDGNHKMIYIKGNEKISVNLLGTDEGTMTFSMAIIDDNGNIVSQKVFEKVSLSKNKKMTSTIPSTPNDEKADVSSVALYVLGSDGIAEKEVLADGKGTEILLNNLSVKPDNDTNKENYVILDNNNTINTDNKTTSPQTGDNSNLILWIALFFVSGASIVSILVFGKCKKCK